MALRSQQPGNRSRLGVPCLLEGARAEPRSALTALQDRTQRERIARRRLRRTILYQISSRGLGKVACQLQILL
jgi:hypothetical protein